jgi:hypothetical protein
MRQDGTFISRSNPKRIKSFAGEILHVRLHAGPRDFATEDDLSVVLYVYNRPAFYLRFVEQLPHRVLKMQSGGTEVTWFRS